MTILATITGREQGAMADYFVVDQRYVYKLPVGMSYEAGALIEPLAVAVHAIKRANIGAGDKVAIIGVGPIGILVSAACKAAGRGRLLSPTSRKYGWRWLRPWGRPGRSIRRKNQWWMWFAS